MDARAALYGLTAALLLSFSVRAAQNVLYSQSSDRPEVFADFARRAPDPGIRTADVRSVIVPHHLLAGPQLHGFFRALAASSKNVKRIVIIGPDHFLEELPIVILSDLPWKTPFGSVACDGETVRLIASKLPSAKVLSLVHNREHSISSVVPFVAEFFPGVPVASVIVKPWLDAGEAAALGDLLAGLPSGTLVILSTDFVHYKRKAETEALDAENGRLIGERFRGGSGEGIRCDCVRGLSALFRFNARAGVTRAEKVLYTNSHAITGRDEPGTSYFFYVFGR